MGGGPITGTGPVYPGEPRVYRPLNGTSTQIEVFATDDGGQQGGGAVVVTDSPAARVKVLLDEARAMWAKIQPGSRVVVAVLLALLTARLLGR